MSGIIQHGGETMQGGTNNEDDICPKQNGEEEYQNKDQEIRSKHQILFSLSLKLTAKIVLNCHQHPKVVILRLF